MADLASTRTKPSEPKLGLWTRRRPIATYGLTLALITLVFLIRAAFAPTLSDHALYLFLLPPVLLAGIVGGWGPGLLATGYSLALQLFATGDFRSLSDIHGPLFAVDLARTITFAALGVAVAWFGNRLQRAQSAALISAEAAAAREAHLKSILDTVPEAMIVID